MSSPWLRLASVVVAVSLTLVGGCRSNDDDAPPDLTATGLNDGGADGGRDDGGSTLDGPKTGFFVASATSLGNGRLQVTFSAPPNALTSIDNFGVSGLALLAQESITGNSVVLTTAPQSAIDYTITATGITRASDGAALSSNTATFTGRTAFHLVGAMSVDGLAVALAFDAPPNPTNARALASYTIPGLTLSGTPTISGNTVTIQTSLQAAMVYTVTVAGVTRASDGEALLGTTQSFDGIPIVAPTITSVTVTATSPDNGTTPYNTGTTTVTILGTELGTVACPSGIVLEDRDGKGDAINTAAIACTVDASTQITATFPAGVRTNGSTGWLVRATNPAGSGTSTQALVPKAGLLISEVYTGSSGSTDHEFLELYNPTAQPIDADALDLHLHLRNGSGVDSNKPLTAVTTAPIPAHGFYLLASSLANSNDVWLTHIDRTYSASTSSLVGNGGAYISLSSDADARVLDKVGWGTQPAPGFEGTALANVPSDLSAERKPALAVGHAIDTDDNASDFATPTTALTPRGTIDPPQPTATFNVISAIASAGVSVSVTFDAPPDPTTATTLGNYSIVGLTLSGTPVLTGNTVTFTTSSQAAMPYVVVVINVTRAGDGKALDTASVQFDGVQFAPPTVTSIAVTSTTPNNGTTPYNTGSVTIAITGTNFESVVCPAGLRLVDLDGAGAPVNTAPTSCTVDSATQITATFPPGLVTNGAIGWPVRVTNPSGAVTSTATLAPVAGLVISEVYTGTTGNTDQEFFELYNRTAQPIDASTLGLRMHLRSSGGADTQKTLAMVGTSSIAPHGFFLIGSLASQTGGASWAGTLDATYSTTASSLVGNGGVYISLSTTADARVLDKVGWGTQQAPGFESTPLTPSIPSDQSAERKPGLQTGHGIDTDVNSDDFRAPSTTITPRGITSAPEPAATFDVINAVSNLGASVTITFNAPPNAAQATTLGNYAIGGLVPSGTPVLSGNSVTITTSPQAAQPYTVVVSNLTRAGDARPLDGTSFQFNGVLLTAPTVTGLTITATNPSNGTTPFNTGTTTMTIAGTQFSTVSCPTGVRLVDLDGAGAALNTATTSCTVDSATQITATFPAGLRTNGAAGWPVRVTNAAGSADSAQPFVPQAGLLISEVYVGSTGNPDHEYVELYNPTALPIDPALLGVRLHVRSSTGTDTHKTLTAVTTTAIPPQGFYLMGSLDSKNGSASWASTIDATYAAGLAGNGGAYISLGTIANAQVIDKVGWGTQPAPGFETAPLTPNVGSDQSAERKPGLQTGHTVDADDNANDFRAPTTTITPRGTASTTEPKPTFNVIAATSNLGASVTVTFDAPPNVAQATTLGSYDITGLVLSGTPTLVGNSVTITTSPQSAQPYVVTVTNVSRAGDAHAIDGASFPFNGVLLTAPTITGVVVAATTPNNGTTPYNTGATTLTITGTQLATVSCPSGVSLVDLDGIDVAVNTAATSCTVDSATQITATIPAGVRTNGSTGWPVRVTNAAGTTTSATPFVPVAGLVLSEIYVGTAGSTNNEYVEVYNRTAQPIDPIALGVRLHVRNSGGTDTHKALTGPPIAAIGAHGFWLLVSAVATGETWFTKGDATFVAGLAGDGGAYLSLSTSANAKVLDKVGWGTPATFSAEGAAAAQVAASQSIERKPGAGGGHDTDTDSNSSDWSASSATLSPRGTTDLPE